jgi:hypothetical protein
VERIRNEVVMGALRGLSVRLGSLREGRKSVIFVSEGFTAILPPQMRRQDASQPEKPAAGGAGRASPGLVGRETAAWFGQSDVNMRMRDVYQMANRNNTSIYSLDPRGLAVFEFGLDDSAVTPSFATDRRVLNMTQDTLRSLSEETDGRAIVNRNTLYEGSSRWSATRASTTCSGTAPRRHGRQVPRHQGAHQAARRRGAGRGAGTGRPRASDVPEGGHAGQGGRQAGDDRAGHALGRDSVEELRPDVGGHREGAAARRRSRSSGNPRRCRQARVATPRRARRAGGHAERRSRLPRTIESAGTPGAGSAGTAPLPPGAGGGRSGSRSKRRPASSICG